MSKSENPNKARNFRENYARQMMHSETQMLNRGRKFTLRGNFIVFLFHLSNTAVPRMFSSVMTNFPFITTS